MNNITRNMEAQQETMAKRLKGERNACRKLAKALVRVYEVYGCMDRCPVYQTCRISGSTACVDDIIAAVNK